MKKNFYSILQVALFSSLLLGFLSANAASTRSEEYLPEGVRIYPSGNNYVTYVYSVELSWDYEPLELTNPQETASYYPTSATPASLTIEGVDGEFQLFPYVDEVFLGYEETPDGDYDYLFGYALTFDFYQDKVLNQANLDDFPFGKYTISVPAGIVKNVLGALNPAQTVELFYMDSPDFDTETFSPPAVDGNWQPIDYSADDLKGVSLTWGMPIAMNENSIPATVRQYSWMDDTPKTPFIYGENIILNENKDALILDMSNLPVGRWTVEFPDGYVFLGENKDMINGSTSATYTITTASGIAALDKDKNGRWTVYDMKGLLILDTNKEDELKAVKPGLYIINGEKVLIRH